MVVHLRGILPSKTICFDKDILLFYRGIRYTPCIVYVVWKFYIWFQSLASYTTNRQKAYSKQNNLTYSETNLPFCRIHYYDIMRCLWILLLFFRRVHVSISSSSTATTSSAIVVIVLSLTTLLLHSGGWWVVVWDETMGSQKGLSSNSTTNTSGRCLFKYNVLDNAAPTTIRHSRVQVKRGCVLVCVTQAPIRVHTHTHNRALIKNE